MARRVPLLSLILVAGCASPTDAVPETEIAEIAEIVDSEPDPGSPAADPGPELPEDAQTQPADDLAEDPDSGDVAPPDAIPDVSTVEPSVSVLSLNLHCLQTKGTPYESNSARAVAIAELVAAENIGAIAVQEACISSAESMMTLLLAALGPGWNAVWEPAHTAWEGTPDEAEEGVGILALGELAQPAVVSHVLGGSLPRVTVCATWGQLRICSVHFDHKDPSARLSQAREAAVAALVDMAPSLDVLIAGDLNAREGKPAHNAMLAAGYVDLSDPLSSTRIDHVFVHRGAAWRADHAELVLDDPAVSDHPAVLVRLAPHVPDPVTVTPIIATADVGTGHYLAVRGDRAPLDWEAGWPMRSTGLGTWRAHITEWVQGPVELKVLRDDTDWMMGPNATGEAGAPIAIVPGF